MEASDFDAYEPKEKLPKLTKGKYLLQIDGTDYSEFHDLVIVETTIEESEGDEALPAGSRAVYFLNLGYNKKNQKFVIERIKNFVYPVLGRRNIPGSELDTLLKSKSAFTGKSIRVSVTEQTDDEGEFKLDNKGQPYLEYVWTAA